jgi:hypothetical protein
MKPHVLSKMSLPIAVLSGLCVAGPAPGDEHSTPLSSTSDRVYPSGADISQKYEKPDAGAAGLVEAFAAPGSVSSPAAMHGLLNQPRTRARIQQQLTPFLRSQTRVQLSPGDGATTALATAAPSAAPALYKFSYGYHYKDVPLWRYSSQSQLIQVKDGARKTILLRERNAPDLDRLGDTEPNVRADDATRAGLDDSRGATDARLAVDDQNEAPHREIHVDAQGKPTLSWAFVVRSTARARPFARRYWVSARGEPTVLAKEDLIYHAAQDEAEAQAAAPAQQGRVVGNIYGFRRSPFDPPSTNQGLNNYAVAARAGGTIVTDTNGFFSLPAGSTPNDHLVGPFCRIINEAGPPLVGTRSGNNLVFNARTEQELAQVSAFKWVSVAHAFVADFLANNDDRLRSLPTHVNIDETCNAFFDPNEHTLNFFKSGDGCVNTAYCDVACHEFGHAVDDQFGGILDGGYSEGFGDALAILITRDSVIGRDFQGKGKPPLRNAKEVVTWPPRNREVHEVGRIYGGFVWELTQLLKSKFGSEDRAFAVARQLVLGAAALNPKDTPDAVRLSFLIDRQGGSPFFKELAAAADTRKIPRPESPGDLDDPRSLTSDDDR